MKIYDANHTLYSNIKITWVIWRKRALLQGKPFSSLIVNLAIVDIANWIIKEGLIYEGVRGVSYPSHAATSKEQNDAFHASWHTTNLNTLADPNIISSSRAIRPQIAYYPTCIRKTGALHASLRLSGLFIRCATPRSRSMSSQSHSSQPTPKGEPCATASPATRLGLELITHANY
jgi:hypothetical protein